MHLGLGGDPQSALVKPRKKAQLETVAEWHKVELLYHHIIGHLLSAIPYLSANRFRARRCLDSIDTQFSPPQTEPPIVGHAYGLVYIPSFRIHAPARPFLCTSPYDEATATATARGIRVLVERTIANDATPQPPERNSSRTHRQRLRHDKAFAAMPAVTASSRSAIAQTVARPPRFQRRLRNVRCVLEQADISRCRAPSNEPEHQPIVG